LPSALAASLLTHGLIVFALLAVWVPGKRVRTEAPAYLSVQLVNTRSDHTVEIPLPLPAPQMPPLVEPKRTMAGGVIFPVEVAPPPQPTAVQAAQSVRRTAESASYKLGNVDIVEGYPMLATFPAEQLARIRGTYPVEVESPVKVQVRPEVAYPPAALEVQRQGRVVAWLAISAEGAVEETIIVDGAPEFAEAVLAALPAARFLPARNRGAAIPFYAILVFMFSGNAIKATEGVPLSPGVPLP